MTTKEVTVTKYISCDGSEFNTCSECEAHEREVMNYLEHRVYELRCKKRELLFAINETRINARITWLDAQKLKPKVRNAKDKSNYCWIMYNYWNLTSAYKDKLCELFEIRHNINKLINELYMWFGLHKKKSSVARLERRKRSLAWRCEHTPDQWRTPNKIRVSKLPKEEQ